MHATGLQSATTVGLIKLSTGNKSKTVVKDDNIFLSDKGNIVSNSDDLCRLFNKYYINVACNIVSNDGIGAQTAHHTSESRCSILQYRYHLTQLYNEALNGFHCLL